MVFPVPVENPTRRSGESARHCQIGVGTAAVVELSQFRSARPEKLLVPSAVTGPTASSSNSFVLLSKPVASMT